MALVFFSPKACLRCSFLRTWMLGADSSFSNSPPQSGKPFFAKNFAFLVGIMIPPPITSRYKNGA